jgi:hypothetical protein
MEPFNSGSAVFILGFALYGLFMPKKTMGSSIQILFSLMFVNGVTSVIVHGSGIRGFGYIDSMSIVVMLMMGTIYIHFRPPRREIFLTGLNAFDSIRV